MNFFQRLRFLIFGTPYVVLKFHDGCMTVKPVHFILNQPYAIPYLSDTRCKLLEGGKAIGPCYVHGWEPATPDMQHYYSPPAEG